MQEVQGQIQLHFGLLYGSIGDPVLLLILLVGFVFGLTAGWVSGMMTAAVFAAIRVGVIDWQQFVPGAEPSAILADIFLFTAVMALLAFAAGKLCRMVIFLPRRSRR